MSGRKKKPEPVSDVLAGWGLGSAIFALCGMIAVIVAFMRQNETARA